MTTEKQAAYIETLKQSAVAKIGFARKMDDIVPFSRRDKLPALIELWELMDEHKSFDLDRAKSDATAFINKLSVPDSSKGASELIDSLKGDFPCMRMFWENRTVSQYVIE